VNTHTADLKLVRSEIGSFAGGIAREWLVTNGLGGFASGTVAGLCTRRYHGLLVAALRPPVERTVLVAKLELAIDYHGTRYYLTANEYADGTIDPCGGNHLESFHVEGLIPVWTWCIADVRIRQRIWMEHGRNTTYVTLELERAGAPLSLEATPLCTWRDYHAHSRGGWNLRVDPLERGCRITAFDGAAPYTLQADRGDFETDTGWYWNFRHRIEAERGLDDLEDLFRPGRFRTLLRSGEQVTFVLSTEPGAVRGNGTALRRERSRQQDLSRRLPAAAPDWIRRLGLAADQFIVERRDAAGNGRTVIAGYPWFSDWGRDTMIALSGLTLTCGRPEIAREILQTFAWHVSDGMLPNRFPDAGTAPEYNTVDATLWYFDAIDRYLEATRDPEFGRAIRPVLESIIDWHERGTRYSIQADAGDGLLYAGEPGVQLTWMDAKVGDRVITPRIGKPVEINALWHRALRVTAALAQSQGDGAAARSFSARADRVRQSFRDRFWNPHAGCLFDVIDGPGGNDAGIRPNQLFAVSLEGGLVERTQARAVVDLCASALWTPYGLRSLSPRDPAYIGRYRGGPADRDAAYHQGTVWSWLLGPFAIAHFSVYGDPAAALSFLEPMEGHLREACVGSISEIFDGDEPNGAHGCFAQAWSVAEILRAWVEISAHAQSTAKPSVRTRRST
jgi:predicted glycogen debranching enzyme